jgi:hypothetical protein
MSGGTQFLETFAKQIARHFRQFYACFFSLVLFKIKNHPREGSFKFCLLIIIYELKPHAEFQNPRTSPSGRKLNTEE